MQVIDNGRLNPVLIISEDEVNVWLRQKADEAGYSDRALCAVQTKLEDGALLLHGSPQITLMVSNIAGSRS